MAWAPPWRRAWRIRLPSRVARLALVNPTLLAATPRDAVLSARISRLTSLLPLWRHLSPGWLASALHSALLPAYAHRDIGAHSLDLYLNTFRSREGRDAACAQLLALRDSRADTAAALRAGAIECPVTLAVGTLDPWLSESRTARLTEALQAATDNRVVVGAAARRGPRGTRGSARPAWHAGRRVADPVSAEGGRPDAGYGRPEHMKPTTDDGRWNHE